MRMKMYERICTAVCRLLVKAHRIGKRRLKQIVISRCEPPQGISEDRALGLSKFVDRVSMLFRNDHYFKWPHRPKRHEDQEGIVFKNDPFGLVSFEFKIVAEQTVSFAL